MRVGGVFAVSGGGVRLRRLPHRDCLGIKKRDMVGNERSADPLLDDPEGSDVVNTESSGT